MARKECVHAQESLKRSHASKCEMGETNILMHDSTDKTAVWGDHIKCEVLDDDDEEDALMTHGYDGDGRKSEKVNVEQFLEVSFKEGEHLNSGGVEAGTEKKPFECTECSYISSRRSAMILHSRTHSGEKPFKCEECSYTAARRSAVSRHSKTHSGVKPFKCTECSYSSARKNDLLMHTRSHTREKPFKCDKCSFNAARKNDLIIHSRIHTGEKPFKCPECSYCAKQRSSLMIHIRIHTGLKPFKCELCSYRAPRRRDIVRHTERIHWAKVKSKNKLIKPELKDSNEKILTKPTTDWEPQEENK